MSRDWINDLNMDVDEAVWGQIWESANNISVYNRARETQFRLLHSLQITPQFRHKLDNSKSELCTKCNVEVGSFIHCVWTCRYIDKYWKDVENRLQLIFDIKPKKRSGESTVWTGRQLKSAHAKRLFSILTFCPRKNILLK